MASSAFAVVVSCFLVAFCAAQQFTQPGNCPNVSPQQNFNAQQVSGNWIGTNRGIQGENRPPSSCLRLSSSQVAADGSLQANLQFKDHNNQNVNVNLNGPQAGNQPGKWTVTASNVPNIQQTLTVLKTDHNQYLALLLCKQKDGNHANSVLVFARQQPLDQASLNEVQSALQANNININLQPVSQANC